MTELIDYAGMSASELETAEWVKKYGPVTEHGYSKVGSKSRLARTFEKHLIERIVTIENAGPVWLYYYDDEQIVRARTGKNLYVPLSRIDEFKKIVVTRAIKQLQKEAIYQATLLAVARRARYAPREIENEVFAVAEDLEFIIVDKDASPIGLAPKK